MSETKYCGNCEFFKEEGADGKGWCTHQSWIASRESACTCFEPKTNGWAEITPDNEHELTDELIGRIVVGWIDNCNRQHIVAFNDCVMAVGTMAKYGGYYYYVLPKIMIE